MAASKKRWPLLLGAVVVGIVVLGAFAVSRLDAILLLRARAEAATLSTKLGRPLSIGGVSTRLFPALGVKAERLEIGRAGDEDFPLAQVARAEVSVRVIPLLTSMGKNIQVSNVEVEGVVLNVIRLKNGTTNLTQLQGKLASKKKPEAANAESEGQLQDLSAVRVDRAALINAVVRFIDGSSAHPKELAISDIDVELKDLRVGQPLEVTLSAAVLQDRQNVHARLRAAPLPKTLVPVPEHFTLKSEPIELSPLGPFFPEAGLLGGTVEADFDAKLGSAVPGGRGETRLKGFLHAVGMRFADAEGGKPVDARLDADVTGDADRGDLSLDVLELKAGEARLTGKGKVKGLRGEAPQLQGFELNGTHLDLGELLLYYPPLHKKYAGQVSGPLEFELKGSGGEGAQSISLDANFGAVRLRIPEQLTKDAGAPMRVSAQFHSAGSNGPLRFEANADLSGADLRPGGMINKAPGQRLTVAAEGTFQPANKNVPLKVDLSKFEFHALQDTVTATGNAEVKGQGRARSVRFSFSAKSPHLDVDALLLPDDTRAPAKPNKATTVAPPKPAVDPSRFSGLRGDVHLEVGALRIQKMDLSRVVAELKMVDDSVTVERFDTGIFGGQVAAGGSSIRLGPPADKRPFVAKVQMKGIDVAQAIASQTDKKILSGKLSGDVNVQGTGVEKASIQKTLSGAITGQLDHGELLGLDLISSVTKPLASALPFASKAGAANKPTSLGETLPFGVTIEKGIAQLKKPISWTRPEGSMSFDGGMKLDGALDLAGTVGLAPATVKALTNGKVVTAEPVPLALKITGPAWAPQISGIDITPAATTLVRLAAVNAARGFFKGSGGAEDQAADQRQETQQKAQDDAAQAKKRLQQEAQKRLEGLFR